jgi:hypothetical protein
LPNIIYPSEAFLPISLLAMDLLENYVPFVDPTDARKGTGSRVYRRRTTATPPHATGMMDDGPFSGSLTIVVKELRIVVGWRESRTKVRLETTSSC